jgi:hypothetical protein
MSTKYVLIFICIIATSQRAFAVATPEKPCSTRAIDLLEKTDPQGAGIYRALVKKSDFIALLDCQKKDYDLPLAVHEGTHFLDAELSNRKQDGRNRYYLLNGDTKALPAISTPARKLILQSMKKTDDFDDTYLNELGGEPFEFLIDELNAYSHGVSAASKLASADKKAERRGERDGLVKFMLYLKLYLENVRRSFPGAWASIQADHDYLDTVRVLWNQAEKALNQACPINQIGMGDGAIMKELFKNNDFQALESILGRKPAQSPACRKVVDAPKNNSPISINQRIMEKDTTVVIKYRGVPCTHAEVEKLMATPGYGWLQEYLRFVKP